MRTLFAILLLPISTFAALVSLQWDYADTSSLSGFQLLVGTNSRSYHMTLLLPTSTTAVVTNLVPGVTNYMAVVAVAGGIQSEPSNELTVYVPAAPKSLRIKATLTGGPTPFGPWEQVCEWSEVAVVPVEKSRFFRTSVEVTY